jgi:pilus assembly protein Flp/PilA
MMDRINDLLTRAYLGMRREEGQTMTEYALVLAIVAVLAIAALTTLSGGINAKLNSIATYLNP